MRRDDVMEAVGTVALVCVMLAVLASLGCVDAGQPYEPCVATVWVTLDSTVTTDSMHVPPCW